MGDIKTIEDEILERIERLEKLSEDHSNIIKLLQKIVDALKFPEPQIYGPIPQRMSREKLDDSQFFCENKKNTDLIIESYLERQKDQDHGDVISEGEKDF